jgi:hypothetical protein
MLNFPYGFIISTQEIVFSDIFSNFSVCRFTRAVYSDIRSLSGIVQSLLYCSRHQNIWNKAVKCPCLMVALVARLYTQATSSPTPRPSGTGHLTSSGETSAAGYTGDQYRRNFYSITGHRADWFRRNFYSRIMGT